MAMACALSCSLSSLAFAASTSSSAPHGLRSSSSLFGTKLKVSPARACGFRCIEKRNVVVKATAADGAEPEVVAEPAVAPAEAAVNPIAALKLQSELLKKKAKKLELRRKRLVRKRHLRKKGRWPPSKMKKNQNV